MPDYKDILLEEQYKAIVRQNEKLAAAAKSGMAEDYAKMLKQLKVMLSDAYEQYSVDGRLTYDQMAKYNRIKKLRTLTDEVITTQSKPIWKKVKNTLEETAQQTFVGSLGAIAEVVNSNIGRELTGKEIMEILSKPHDGLTLEERIGLRRTDLGVKLNTRITQSYQKEETYKDLITDVRKIVTKDYARNANTLDDLNTFTQNEVISNSIAEAGEKGVRVTKVWISAGDSRVREDHVLLDGQEVDGDDVFTIPSGPNKGMTADGPGLFGDPAEDYNCRCYVIANVKARE